MRITSSTGRMNIFPSPMRPVFCRRFDRFNDLRYKVVGAMNLDLHLGRKSTTYSAPRYSSVWPFCLPKPFTSATVIPWTPMAFKASLTSSSLKA